MTPIEDHQHSPSHCLEQQLQGSYLGTQPVLMVLQSRLIPGVFGLCPEARIQAGLRPCVTKQLSHFISQRIHGQFATIQGDSEAIDHICLLMSIVEIVGPVIDLGQGRFDSREFSDQKPNPQISVFVLATKLRQTLYRVCDSRSNRTCSTQQSDDLHDRRFSRGHGMAYTSRWSIDMIPQYRDRVDSGSSLLCRAQWCSV